MENHEDPRPQKRIRSGKDVVRFYKGLGFFAGESVESVVRRYRKDMECAPDAGIGFDAELLSFDEKKTWHNSESDQDVQPFDDFYCWFLQEFAGVTGGAFVPREISEHWESPTGPIRVKFQLGGHTMIVTPRCDGGAVDFHILRQVNGCFRETDRQFECIRSGFMVILWITPEQKRAMQRIRHVDFLW